MVRSKSHNGFAKARIGALMVVALMAYASPTRAYQVLLTERGASVRWYTPAVTLRIAPDLEAYFGDMPVAQLLTEAAAAWGGLDDVPELLVSGATYEAPGFHKGGSNNGVYLVEDWTFRPDALAVTVATFETMTGRLVDADIQINADYPFSWSALDTPVPDGYDLRSVLTHEIGHVLGLGDASDAPAATMWPSIAPGETRPRDIDTDDEAGAESLYAESGKTMGGGGCGRASVLWQVSARALWTKQSAVLCMALALALLIWARSRLRRSRALFGPVIVLGGALLFGDPAAPARAPPPRSEQDALSPTQWLPREHPIARQRLAALLQDADGLIEGRASSRRVERRGGLLWTRLRVQHASGVTELVVPGGSLDGLTQIVSGQAPPHEGSLLVIALRKHGPHAWAHLQAGLVYGGSLGEGPALQW